MDFNSTNQRGHLARDPQITKNEKGIIARFTLAVNRPKKANGESAGADFISCVCYSPEADKLLNVKKGAHVALTGPIVTGSYDKEGVGKVYTTDVRADILFVYPDTPAQNQTPQTSAPAQPQAQPQAGSPFGNSGFPTPPNQPVAPVPVTQPQAPQQTTQPQQSQQSPVDNFANMGSGLPWA